MKRRATITDYFIKASYSTENNDDKNDDEELPTLPGSEKNKDTPHTSQIYKNDLVKGDDNEESSTLLESKKKKDAPYTSEVTERDPVKGKKIAFTLLCKGLGPYQPEMDKYPKVNRRKFCIQWYESYKWLEYSPEKDAVFCFYCRAFDLSGRYEESFTINGFNKWSKASTCLPKHERSVPHKEAMVKLAGFKQDFKQDIEERFKENNLTLLNAMNDVLTSDLPDVASYNLVSNTYGVNNSELQSEVNIFNRMFKQSQNDMKETALNCQISYLLSNNIQVGFPLYAQILKLFLTLPTNTATCERSFSTLKRLKSYLRSTTGQDRLNNLAILYVHRDQEVNKDEVIKEFDAIENGRRMILH